MRPVPSSPADAAPAVIDWQISTFAELPSTQDYLRDLLDAETPEGLVIQSLSQTGGRGRQGRQWQSPLGNLYMSLLLRPICRVETAGQLSFVTAVAVSAAMDEYLRPGTRKTVKWPNDILIDGKKSAGILIESILGAKAQVDCLIIGIGVNVLSPPDEGIGLAAVSNGPVPIHPLRDQILTRLAQYYLLWQEEGFVPIRDLWLAQAHALNEKIRARFAREEVEGVFRGLDDRGALLLETAPDRLRTISAAEIVA